MKKQLLSVVFVTLFVLTSCSGQTESPKAKYVFLFIGDGMGMNQVYATELYLAAQKAIKQTKNLNLSNLPVQSYQTTYSANSWVTCSSASGTALATGFKTNNGVLGKDPTLTINYETVAEKAKKEGYKVGILSSVGINHATPASFYAHQNYRGMYYEIGLELPISNFDYFGGGGIMVPKGCDGNKPNVYENAVKAGYTYVNTTEAIEKLKNGDEKILAVNPILSSKAEFTWEIDHVKGSISLAEFTKKGIEVIDNTKGFFMMVEGGKIDWACHANDGAACVQEVLAFDAAIAKALDFYNQHAGETLIIVTADHETGGMIIGNGNEPNMQLLQYQNISAQEFGRELVSLHQLNKKVSFEQVMELVQKHFGLGDAGKGLALKESEIELLKNAYNKTFENNEGMDPEKEYFETDKYKTIPDIAINILNHKAGLKWSGSDHSGTPVPVRAIGQGQDYFSTSIDNTDVAKIIEKVMGL